MEYETKSKMLFFFLGVVLTLLLVIATSAISAISADKLNTQNTNTQNIDVNTPTPALTQNTENERNIPSPMNYFSEDQIKVYKDRVILNAENIQWASFEDTKSMLPVLSNETNALQIVPKCPEEIQVGDIVSYVSEYADGIIIHRVAFEGNDDKGVYFVLKGDNNPASDPGKIRCSQIQRKVVAIIY
jgi:hypothetical protein